MAIDGQTADRNPDEAEPDELTTIKVRICGCLPVEGHEEPPRGYRMGTCEKCHAEIWIGPDLSNEEFHASMVWCVPCVGKAGLLPMTHPH